MPTTDHPCLPAATGETAADEGARGPHLFPPAAILADIPSWLGFRPSPGDLVILGLREGAPLTAGDRSALRYDLPRQPDERRATIGLAVAVLSVERYDVVIAVGYGPGDLVAPLVPMLRQMLRRAAGGPDPKLAEALRVEDGRYWSLLCQDAGCCPPEGTAYGELADQKTSAALPDGRHQVLASRDVLAALLAPVTGRSAITMRDATRRAASSAARITPQAANADLEEIRRAITRYREGDRDLYRAEAARITVALREESIRDDAWSQMDPAHREAHLQLWTDLTRLARPGYVAAPASLLAFTAWQSGNGALANVALDRALDDDPGYRMAQLLRDITNHGFPWWRARTLLSSEPTVGWSE